MLEPASTELTQQRGALYLVPAALDFGCDEAVDLQLTMPMQTLAAAARLRYWVCENAKSARAYLKRVGDIQPLICPIQSLAIEELPRAVHKKGDHSGNFDARYLLAPALTGHDIGLLSEAGMPAIADPGSSVVRAAHALGLLVLPLTGPMSLMLALAASGLNGQSFAFVGYLPAEAGARAARIRELETLARKSGQTQLFIETPYRNAAMLQTLLQTLQGQTRLAVCSGLTLSRQVCHSDSVQGWRKHPAALDNATPAVFALGL